MALETETVFVDIFHPSTGLDGNVPQDSLREWYRAGWRLLVDDDRPAAAKSEDPPPVTRKEAAAVRGKLASTAPAAKSDDKSKDE